MKKKIWNAPQVIKLGVENTEHGTSMTPKIDGTIYDGNVKYWSFS